MCENRLRLSLDAARDLTYERDTEKDLENPGNESRRGFCY